MAMNFDTNVVVNTGKTLTVNGKEVITDEFSGATSSANGSKGYVPAPSSGDRTKFLKADGTWAVPPVPPNMAGATASTAGLAGLVPAPAAGDQNKFLKGDGTWDTAGETVYGNTIDMSSTDSTKVATAINAKLDANQGSANAGKFMRVGSAGAVTYDNPTERYASESNFPATGDAGKLYIAEDTGGIYIWDGTNTEYVAVGGGNGAETVVFYGTSSTANNTSPKIVSISDEFYDASDIPSGTIVFIKFENSNTIYSTLALNINNTGNVYVCTMDAKTYGDAFRWDSGEMIPFVYDGVLNKWRILHYGVMKGATSSQSGEKGFVPAPAAGDQDKVLHGDGTWKTPGDGTLRVVPFSIGVASWTLSGGVYSCTVSSEYVTVTSVEFIEYDSSYRMAVRGDLNATKATGGGGVVFTTDVLPVATLSGEIRVFDSDDGKVAIVTQMTALPTIRDVPFTVAVSDWALNANDLYEAVFTTAFVTETSHDFVEFDESIENAMDGIKVIKAESSGSVVGLKFISRRIPAGSISGTITPLDNADGKIAVVLEDTVVPISNGGTGANTITGAQDNLGISELYNNNPQIISNENGTAYKFANGMLICSKVVSGTYSVNQSWGQIYESSSQMSFGDWAVQFIEIPIVSGTNVSTSEYASTAAWLEMITSVTTTSAGKSYIARPTVANQRFSFHIVGIGRWK